MHIYNLKTCKIFKTSQDHCKQQTQCGKKSDPNNINRKTQKEDYFNIKWIQILTLNSAWFVSRGNVSSRHSLL